MGQCVQSFSPSLLPTRKGEDPLKNAMGSLMVYVRKDEMQDDGWYVCFEKRNDSWKIRDTIGIAAKQIEKWN
jgi:hypothetical protein